MSLTVTCPHCKTQGSVPDAADGHAVRCQACSKTFRLGAAASSFPLAVAPAAVHDGEPELLPEKTPTHQKSLWQTALPIARAALWGFYAFCALLAFPCYFIAQAHAETVLQQAVYGITYCFLLIFGYTVARAIDSATRW